MIFRLEMECNNEAFRNPDGDHDPGAEVASILEGLCRSIREGRFDGSYLYDTNGNHVGFARFEAQRHDKRD